MIIFRYLAREIILTTIVVISILLWVFLCQILIRYLNAIAIGRYPSIFLWQLLLAEVPYLLTLLIPLGFYIATILVLGRMRADTELVVLVTSGIGFYRLLYNILVIASGFAILASILSFYVNPKILASRQAIRMQAQSAALVDMLTPGQFHKMRHNRILYVKSLTADRARAADLFIAQQPDGRQKPWQVMVAREGWVAANPETGDNYIVLKDGHRYTGISEQPSLQVLQFGRYAMQIPTPRLTARADPRLLTVQQLWQDPSNRAYQAEWQWRLALPLSLWVLAIMAVVIEGINPKTNRYAKMIPGALLYIIYAHGLFLAKEWLKQGVMPITFGLWWVHAGILGMMLWPKGWRYLCRCRLWMRR